MLDSRLRHAGIYVDELESMKKFYMTCFDLSVFKEGIENGSYLESFLGIKGVSINVCKLIDKNGMILELIQAERDYGDNHSDLLTKRGCVHVAMTVSDIEGIYDQLIMNGGTPISAPLVSPDKKASVFFCRDPEGNYLELVQEL